MIQNLLRLTNRYRINTINMIWRLYSKIEMLEDILEPTLVLIPHHIRRNSNKLANWGVENLREDCDVSYRNNKYPKIQIEFQAINHMDM